MDFVFGLPNDLEGNTGIVVFVDRLSKMAHLAAVPDSIDGEGTALLFLDRVFFSANTDCHWQLSLTAVFVLWASSGRQISRCSAPD